MVEPSRKRRKTNNDESSNNLIDENKPYMVTVKQEQYTGGSSSSSEERLKGAQYHCNYCKKDISSQVRIKCAECADFDLCVDCFFVGVETTGHKNYHSYRVMDDMSAPIYTTKWGADEELLLLEGIEMFGLGNWVDVAEHVGTKNKFECEYHYWSTYVDVETFPLPPNNRPLREDRVIGSNDVKKTDDGMLVLIKKQLGIKTSASCTSNYENKNIKLSHPRIGLEVGFIPYRGDFDVEYDNDAELLIGEMEITENDTPQEREMKLKVLKLYDYKLAERELRKKFAIERNLIDWKKNTSTRT
jgi:transcriptional adapter 2-alpha